MRKHIIYLLIILIGICNVAMSQDDLMDLLGSDDSITNYTYATFKTTRIINAQSIENPAKGVMIFLIQHRFGRLNSGAYELFGLDEATLRLGFEYGITERLAVGFGRSTYQKTFDGFVKYKILRQSSGLKKMPVALSYIVTADIISLKWEDYTDPERTNYFSSRVSYTHQLLIARKFNKNLSLQLMPTLVHKNLVKYEEDKNNIYSVGLGGRYKITNRTSINGEYFYVFPNQIHSEYDNSLSLGFDIETGGHVFQLVFTNSKAMFDRGFITETVGKWEKGDIYFGFNISRVFTLKKPETFKK